MCYTRTQSRFFFLNFFIWMPPTQNVSLSIPSVRGAKGTPHNITLVSIDLLSESQRQQKKSNHTPNKPWAQLEGAPTPKQLRSAKWQPGISQKKKRDTTGPCETWSSNSRARPLNAADAAAAAAVDSWGVRFLKKKKRDRKSAAEGKFEKKKKRRKKRKNPMRVETRRWSFFAFGCLLF